MELLALVGGTPGLDCGGSCKFCYFRRVDFKKLESLSLGCRNCPPHEIGCRHCRSIIEDVKSGFRPLSYVLRDFKEDLVKQELSGSLRDREFKVNIGSWADIIFYPKLPQLISTFKEWGMPVHLGYTSGKGIQNESMTEDILSTGVDEISFSVFSTNPEIRRKWMNDKTAEESLKALKTFCERLDVNGSTVVIPGITDQEEIFQTCATLEEWGIKTFILIRFANFPSQGLILNQKPIIPGTNPHSFEEFQELVLNVAREFNFRIMGIPASDPENEIPFALSKTKNREFLENLPPIQVETTILTSALSAPYLKKIFETIDEANLVNVISLEKEIADLIIPSDLTSLNLQELKKRVIIPGKALVHDKQAEELLSRDGKKRLVFRGPQFLSPVDFYGNLSKEEIINHELSGLKLLIKTINKSGG